MQDRNSLRGYHILEYKGKGTLFQNFLVERDGRKYILKVYTKGDSDDSMNKIDWILDKFQKNDGVYNNNLQKIIDVFHNLQHKYLVTEYFPEGNIIEYMLTKNIPRFDVAFSVTILADIFRGISRLHEKRQYHMNLRLENIFFRNNYENVTICDYRIQYIDQSINYYFANEYLPPEMIGKGKIDLKSEIWTLGVIFFVLLFGQFPFFNLDEIKLATVTTKFDLKSFLKSKGILDLDSKNPQDKSFRTSIADNYGILQNFFLRIFESSQENRITYIQLCSDPIFTIGKVHNLSKEKEIYEGLGTMNSFREIKRKESGNVSDDSQDDQIDESVQDKRYIYDMELEGAKKGVEFKNNRPTSIISAESAQANYMDLLPNYQSIYATNQIAQSYQQTVENSQLEASMLISYYDRSKIMKDNVQGINHLQYCYSVMFSKHEFLLLSLQKILESSAFKYKQKIILKYFLIKCALHFGQQSLQAEDTNSFYSDIWQIWRISVHKSNQKQYLANFVRKQKVDLFQSYLQIQGSKDQLTLRDQDDILTTLKGSEDFDKEIKSSFRKVLAAFISVIEKIIETKKNLPEETIEDLKRNQLRAIICGSANRCFAHDRLQEVFPFYIAEHKTYTLQTFSSWIESMGMADLDREIKTVPTHFYKAK